MYKPEVLSIPPKMRTPEQKKLAKRITIEHRIVRHMVRDLLQQGYAISTHNGGDEPEIRNSTNFKDIIDVMAETDEETVYVHRRMEDGEFNKKSYGSIYLVYGNDGYDVIADYSTKLEEPLKGTLEYADKFQD